jgi:hypothetical protein
VVFHADIVAKKVEIRVALLYVPRDPMGCVSPTGKVRADMLHIRACPHDVIDNLEQALRVIGQRSILGARRTIHHVRDAATDHHSRPDSEEAAV